MAPDCLSWPYVVFTLEFETTLMLSTDYLSLIVFFTQCWLITVRRMEWLWWAVWQESSCHKRFCWLLLSVTDPGQAERLWGLMSPLPVGKLKVLRCFVCQHSTSDSPQVAAVVTWRFRSTLSNEWNCRQRGSVALRVGQAGGRKEGRRGEGETCRTALSLWQHNGGIFWGKLKLILHVCSVKIYSDPNPHSVDKRHWSRDTACPHGAAVLHSTQSFHLWGKISTW